MSIFLKIKIFVISSETNELMILRFVQTLRFFRPPGLLNSSFITLLWSELHLGFAFWQNVWHCRQYEMVGLIKHQLFIHKLADSWLLINTSPWLRNNKTSVNWRQLWTLNQIHHKLLMTLFSRFVYMSGRLRRSWGQSVTTTTTSWPFTWRPKEISSWWGTWWGLSCCWHTNPWKATLKRWDEKKKNGGK